MYVYQLELAVGSTYVHKIAAMHWKEWKAANIIKLHPKLAMLSNHK